MKRCQGYLTFVLDLIKDYLVTFDTTSCTYCISTCDMYVDKPAITLIQISVSSGLFPLVC